MPRTRALLALALGLTACTPPGLPAGKPSDKLRAAAALKASPASPGSPAASPLPGGASPTSAPVAQGPDVLLAPTTRQATTLTGSIAIDARYAIAQGAASLISDHGGGLLQLAGGQLLSNNSGNVVNREHAGIVSHNGAGLVGKSKFISDQGGGLISDLGGGLIANNGGGLVANNGGGLVANNGGGLVANNGGGLVANNGGGLTGKTKFALAEAAAAGATAGPTVLPAAGMLVAVLSLVDGAYLPLGVDRAGKPVYAVYTNAKGEFTVHLPAELAQNVLVVSAAPGSQDPRLALDLVASSASRAPLRVDETTTVITGYMRRSLVARLEEKVMPDPCQPPAVTDSPSSQGFAIVALALQPELEQPAFQGLTRAARRRVLGRVADVALANVDLAAIPTARSLAPRSKGEGPAYALLAGVLADVEAKAAERLRAQADYFDGRPAIQLANRAHPARPVVLRKPADVAEFIVDEFATSSDGEVLRRAEAVFADLGLDPALKEELQLAGGSVFAGMVPYLLSPEGAAATLTAVRAAIAEEAAAQAAAGPASPEPACPSTPTPPAFGVPTAPLAGGEKGGTDGPGDVARFDLPAGLAYDPRGFLFVAERGGQRIRRIDLKAAGHPVVTIAGDGEAGSADGLGPAARFNAPTGLALDGQGALYVADRDNHLVRKLTGLDGPAATVTTLAGTGRAGYADGAGAAAGFNQPSDLTVGPDGALYVADTKNHRVRRVDLAGGSAAVTTIAGTGLQSRHMGLGTAADLDTPHGLAFWPDGRLAIAEAKANRLLAMTPALAVAVYAGKGPNGADDGSFYDATFDQPFGLALAPDGRLVVADTKRHRVRLIDPRGVVGTLAGGGAADEPGGYVEGVGAAARLAGPEGVAVGDDGTVYVADTKNHRVRTLKLPAP